MGSLRLKFSASLILFVGSLCQAEEIRIATWNLEWFYDADVSDNPNDLQRRMSAPSVEEFEARAANFAAAIANLNPDIIALQEVENRRTVAKIAEKLRTLHQSQYNVGFVQGDDSYTGQDVAFLIKSGIKYDISRFRFEQSRDDRYKGLSKHARLKTTVGGEQVEIVTLHLITNPDERLKQARTLRRWVDPLVGGNLIVLGDFNVSLRFDQTRPHSDIGLIRGFATPTTKDDLLDLHSELSVEGRKTHISGRELDRILVSPRLRDGTGLEVTSIVNRRDLAIRGSVDRATGVDYYLDDDEQDLSDHFPLLITLDAASTPSPSGRTN